MVAGDEILPLSRLMLMFDVCPKMARLSPCRLIAGLRDCANNLQSRCSYLAVDAPSPSTAVTRKMFLPLRAEHRGATSLGIAGSG